MKIAFYGHFAPGARAQISKIAQDRKHEIAQSRKPAAVVFMMGYPLNLAYVAEAHRLGGFVVVLSAGWPSAALGRLFFLAGVYDVRGFPYDKRKAEKMFAEFEEEMAEIFS